MKRLLLAMALSLGTLVLIVLVAAAFVGVLILFSSYGLWVMASGVLGLAFLSLTGLIWLSLGASHDE